MYIYVYVFVCKYIYIYINQDISPYQLLLSPDFFLSSSNTVVSFTSFRLGLGEALLPAPSWFTPAVVPGHPGFLCSYPKNPRLDPEPMEG